MKLDASEFRRIMGHFATGVTVVSSRDIEQHAPCALTVNAVASVAVEPMLVLVCIEHAADSHDCIIESGVFSINILAADQERLSRRFATWEAERKFEGIAYRAEATGAPVLDGVLAWLDCRIRATHPGGDHTIVVGEVEAGDARSGSPLIYFRSGYTQLNP